MKIYSKLPSKQIIKENILKYYTSPSNWYNEYNQWLHKVSQAYGLPFFKVCGIFAVYSANASIDMNLMHLYRFLHNPTELTGMTMCYNKALCIYQSNGRYEDIIKIISTSYINGKYTNSYKVRSFFINLCFPNVLYKHNYKNVSKKVDRFPAITIDTHAINICVDGVYTKKLTKNRYTYLARIYNDVAAEIGVLPQQLQADTWINFRKATNKDWYSNKEQQIQGMILENSFMHKNMVVC